MKWGVISTAKIGTEKVIPAMQESDQLEILAIAGRDLGKTREVAENLRIPRAYGSYEELLADPSIEAIYNPLPNHLHVEWTIKALEAGKHVLCEKPIGLDTTDAKRLIEARDKSGKQVLEAFMVRHHPQWVEARKIIESGQIGELTTVQSIFTYFNADPNNVRNKKDIGGGGLLDIGCYCIVGPRYVTGKEPIRVVSLMDKDPKFGTDRLVSGMLDFGSGLQASFVCGTQSAAVQRVHILGTEGRIEILMPFNPIPETRHSFALPGRNSRALTTHAKSNSRSAITIPCKVSPRPRYSRAKVRSITRSKTALPTCRFWMPWRVQPKPVAGKWFLHAKASAIDANRLIKEQKSRGNPAFSLSCGCYRSPDENGIACL
ncbi:Gfo/Idh/MocA family protein [Thalassospira lucentensis]|uniref:Gfo/Idh/MocA family protein n=1 Tax=Thalassospira lucentensis TaxID=168935 RepID=UPI0039EEF20F